MTTQTAPTAPVGVLIVSVPETAGSALYGMLDVLSAAGHIWPVLLRSAQTRNGFRVRIEAAKEQLETTRTAVDEISAEVGYDDASFFRRLFKRRVGLAPLAYRRMFGTDPGRLPQRRG